METARNTKITKKVFSLALALILAAAFLPHSEVQAAAGGVQKCTVGTTCKIGEFLYDDTSTPIAGAACTITSNYPDNTNFLNAQALSGGGADGWYYYDFTTPATEGIYSTSVCCTTGGDTLCIDKGFEAAAASTSISDPDSIASAVWSYSGRTVTSFGTLIADIWANATRTLTGAGLSSGQLATQSDVTGVRDKVDTISTNSTNVTNVTNNVTEVKNIVDETRLLIEQVVNKPIIENVLEDTDFDLTGKIKDSKTAANQLFVNNQYFTTQVATLVSKWNSLSGEDALEFVIALSEVVGETSDSSSTGSMFASSNNLKDSWGWDEAESLNAKLISMQKSLADLKEGLADYEKTPQLLSLSRSLVKDSLALEKIIGSQTDKSSSSTIFAKIKSTEALASSLDDKGTQVDSLLAEYTKNKDNGSFYSKLSALKKQIIALNKVPSAGGMVLGIKTGDEKSVKNALLSLRGLINSNKRLLALGSGKTLVNTWLEIGSIVFKTLATNPSTLISQDVTIKYYLPAEIKEEDIIKTDAGLAVKYDSEKNQFYAEGVFTLAPGQTRTFSIETNDIWEVTSDEIASLRTETESLFTPLEKTAFFAQGVSLKSDIISALDEIESLQETAVTPEDKIRSYREADILKKSAETKIAGMRELVAQASSTGSLFGFVGGSQTIAVWGIIITVAAGFILMTMYMRSVMGGKKVVEHTHTHTKRPASSSSLKFAALLLATGVVSATATGYFVAEKVSKSYEQKLNVLGTQIEAVRESKNMEKAASTTEETSAVSEEDLGVGGPFIVVVSDTPTGFLRVRRSPGGIEIAQVVEGEKLIYLDENEEWYQVELENGTQGWVSKEYSVKE